MRHFAEEPFSLRPGQLIVIRAEAVNENGKGDPSPLNKFGARMARLPSMSAPTLVSKTETSVQLSWSQLPAGADGKEPYTYEVLRAQGTGAFAKVGETAGSSLTVPDLTRGESYRFKV